MLFFRIINLFKIDITYFPLKFRVLKAATYLPIMKNYKKECVTIGGFFLGGGGFLMETETCVPEFLTDESARCS